MGSFSRVLGEWPRAGEGTSDDGKFLHGRIVPGVLRLRLCRIARLLPLGLYIGITLMGSLHPHLIPRLLARVVSSGWRAASPLLTMPDHPASIRNFLDSRKNFFFRNSIFRTLSGFVTGVTITHGEVRNGQKVVAQIQVTLDGYRVETIHRAGIYIELGASSQRKAKGNARVFLRPSKKLLF